MPYEPDDYLTRHVQTSSIDLASKVDELLALAAPNSSVNLPLYRDMLSTVPLGCENHAANSARDGARL